MIRIKRGPMIEAYASIFLQKLDFDHDESVDAVLEWVNGYISGPWIEPLASVIEKTEKERKDAILGYIQAMVETSTTGRIKAQLKKERECSTKESAQSADRIQ